MQETRSIRVMLVDDHELVRLGLRVVIEGCAPLLELVGEADSVETAIARAHQARPDVVLMDLYFGGAAGNASSGGIDACREILAANPGAKVIFLSSYADEESIIATVLAGASGFFEKDIAPELLISCIRKVAEGQSILDPKISRMVIDHLTEVKKLGDQQSLLETLTAQETKILKLVVEGKTNKEIARLVGLSDKTVRNYLSNVFQKLNVERRSHAVAIFMKLERLNP